MGRAALLLCLLAGCVDMRETVLRQAALDFTCPPDAVYVLDGELGIYRVRGCGHEASYRCSDGTDVGQVACELLDLKTPREAGRGADGRAVP